MSSILIKNCNLISMDSNRSKIEYNIDILVKNGKISKIEKNIIEQTDQIVEAEGNYVIPGLINTHNHLPMSLFKESVDGHRLFE
jgi:cytosine/adenosine deaminase-related metal-dependent hydrolase